SGMRTSGDKPQMKSRLTRNDGTGNPFVRILLCQLSRRARLRVRHRSETALPLHQGELRPREDAMTSTKPKLVAVVTAYTANGNNSIGMIFPKKLGIEKGQLFALYLDSQEIILRKLGP